MKLLTVVVFLVLVGSWQAFAQGELPTSINDPAAPNETMKKALVMDKPGDMSAMINACMKEGKSKDICNNEALTACQAKFGQQKCSQMHSQMEKNKKSTTK